LTGVPYPTEHLSVNRRLRHVAKCLTSDGQNPLGSRDVPIDGTETEQKAEPPMVNLTTPWAQIHPEMGPSSIHQVKVDPGFKTKI
jgi:hypothetical protein